MGALLVYKAWSVLGHKKEVAVHMPTASIPVTATLITATTNTIDPEKKIISAPPATLTVDEQKKWSTLRDIMKSKNDNDSRLDKDLYNLSLLFHAELVKQYQNLPMESRNERGLIAFLIARDAKDSQDFEFLKSVYQESPCLSLDDCNTPSHGDPHLSGVDQTSANYPQLATLYQLERQINSGNLIFQDSNVKDQMRQLLANAAQFPVPMVAKKAESLRASHPF